MANRWRALHKRKSRSLRQTQANQYLVRYWSHSYHDQGYYPEFEDEPPFDDDDDNDGTCYWCGGDGWIEGAEEDPLWYGDDLIKCSSCGGSGRAKDMTI